ncbi:ty3-gypsy retrotransposon protein [Tanacetum coccineum]|uniref:Ty3-gypsy retrotransposon protein n=1 Tax=Tanacetum coccineum TaxID=301880 RepID=A0ABQ5ED07_9ASTR
MSTYEKELLAIVYALEKWRGYLLDRHFKIKTDHFSLKYLLDQRMSTPTQLKWLLKLMGFDYEIQYKKGVENVTADALSRIQHSGELFSVISTSLTTKIYQKILRSLSTDEKLKEVIQQLQARKTIKGSYTWANQELRRKGKLVVGDDQVLRTNLLKQFHEGSVGGHSGVSITTHKIFSVFYRKKLRKQVKQMVMECDTCQRNKVDFSTYPGLLQPLPMPATIWSSISMDFVQGLPKSQGKTVIFVVVDRLSKYAYFMPLAHPFTATDVAQVFLDNIYKLHGLPNTIISDKGKVFLSTFWKELFKLLQVKLHMSTSYHPRTDGQTKVVNRCLECYLRCMTGEQPKQYMKWLSLAEWWYNTNHHSSIDTTPFEIVYGQPPSVHVPYVGGKSRVDAVDRTFIARETTIELLNFN